MNKGMIESLGIEATECEEVLEALKDMRLDIEQRLEHIDNESRKEMLTLKLGAVEKQIKEVSAEVEAKKAAEKAAQASDAGKTSADKPGEKRGHGRLPVASEEPVEAPKRNFLVAGDTEEEDKQEKKTAKAEEKAAQKAEKEDKKREKEQQKELDQHEEELHRQAKELRKDMQNQKKQEAEDKKNSPDQGDDQDSDNKNPSATSSGSKGNGGNSANLSAQAAALMQELGEGIRDYAKGDFKNAFIKISKAANQGDDVGLPDKDRGIAEHLLGRMYQKGEGTTASDERAVYWFEKAANHDNIDGCLEMGTYHISQTPGSAREDKEIIKKCLKYYGKAAKLGSMDAKSKFVTVCETKKHRVGLRRRIEASGYCKELRAGERDEYLKDQWTKRGRAILMPGDGDYKNNKKKSMFLGSFKEVLAFLGALLGMLGSGYLVQALAANSPRGLMLTWLPRIAFPEFLVIWKDFVLDAFHQIVGSYDMVAYMGVFMLVISFFMSGFSDKKDRSGITEFLCALRYYLLAFVMVYGGRYALIYGYLSNRFDTKELFVLFGGVLIACLTAHVIASGIKKIFS